jgi:hypothetical protein
MAKPKGYYSKGKVKSKDAVDRAKARQSITTLRGIAGLVGGAVVEGIGGPVGKGAKVARVAAKTSSRVARAMAKEAAGPRAKAPFPTYRKPSPNRRPRLRDTDNMPRKTTVRQLVGPKTKSGKMIEKKYPKTNTQPPAKKPTTVKPKTEGERVVKVNGRVIAIRKPAANPRIRKREEAQLRISRREFLAERKRQEKLEIKRRQNPKVEKDEMRPSQLTIESRLQSGSESLPLSARNQTGTDRMPTAEWRRYAQILRDSTAKSPNISKTQIERGRARATMPTAERRAAEIQAARNRAIAKAKARGMTDAQIKQLIARARAEAASIARKAAK